MPINIDSIDQEKMHEIEKSSWIKSSSASTFKLLFAINTEAEVGSWHPEKITKQKKCIQQI